MVHGGTLHAIVGVEKGRRWEAREPGSSIFNWSSSTRGGANRNSRIGSDSSGFSGSGGSGAAASFGSQAVLALLQEVLAAGGGPDRDPSIGFALGCGGLRNRLGASHFAAPGTTALQRRLRSSGLGLKCGGHAGNSRSSTACDTGGSNKRRQWCRGLGSCGISSTGGDGGDDGTGIGGIAIAACWQPWRRRAAP